jgi:hypothetical protein
MPDCGQLEVRPPEAYNIYQELVRRCVDHFHVTLHAGCTQCAWLMSGCRRRVVVTISFYYIAFGMCHSKGRSGGDQRKTTAASM